MAEAEEMMAAGKRGPGRPKGSGKRGPGRPKGSGKRGPGRPKGSGKRGPKAGKKRRGRRPALRATGLIGKAVAQQLKAALKRDKAATRALVQSLVAKELKRAFKSL